MGSSPIRDVLSLPMQYQENVFTKIVNKKLKADILIEDEYTICFRDVNPQSKIHYLVIPKMLCIDFLQFEKNASIEQKISFWKTVADAISILSLTKGYKLITNSGEYGKQEIPHFHLHILG